MSLTPAKPVLVANEEAPQRPSREQALDAVRTLIAWAGDDPARPGLVILRDIEVESHCAHHMAPFLGKAYVAYLPGEKVVGISKLALVVEIFARRLQNQETLTNDIIDAIESHLQPRGVAVLVDAEHQCMTTRGVHHRHVSTITTRFTGAFKDDPALMDRFLKLAKA